MRSYILITGANPSPKATYKVLLEGFSNEEVQTFVQDHCTLGEGVNVVVGNGQGDDAIAKETDNARIV
jgi:hypothetical protein